MCSGATAHRHAIFERNQLRIVSQLRIAKRLGGGEDTIEKR